MFLKSRFCYTFLMVCIIMYTTAYIAQAQSDTAVFSIDTAEIHILPQVEIMGKKDVIFRKLPGSATFIDSKEIKLLAPVSGNEVFRRSPGVHVVDEEGAGLRVNIGIRGLDPDRSRSVLMLEDGVPVALNPYGEPEMYYTPSMDRMAGVEILKGSGQIMYGPQTIGGVINYITPNPPEKEELKLILRGGQYGYFSGYGSYGTTVGKTGFIVNYLHKRADNMGPTWFRVNDLNFKTITNISDKSRLSFKAGIYDEISNSTYIGINQAMYDMGGMDYLRLAPHDRLPVRRYSTSINHLYKFSPSLTLSTTAFAYTITRNWQRQNYSRSSFDDDGNPKRPNDWDGNVWGDESVENGALYMRNSNAHRNRQFEVAGAESRLTYIYNVAGIENKFETGVRYMYERAYEQFLIGKSADAPAGALRDNEIRTGRAISGFAQNKISIDEKISFTPGLRIENYNFERNILRGRYRNINSGVDTNIVASREILEFIPGIGMNYNLNKQTTIFLGTHKGYAPPRVKDAITPQGVAMELDAENSWNSEFGARTKIKDGLNLEATVFHMVFSNQIIPAAQSAGGAGVGLVNAGATRHKGIEGAVNVNFGKLLEMDYAVLFDANITYVDARFSSNRYFDDSINVRGNILPYAPRLFFSSALGLETPHGAGIRFTGTYVGEQYADNFQSIQPSADGLTGKINSYYLIDATAYYKLKNFPASINISAKNLTNERYIASRRPEGIRVGMPRMVTAGLEILF